MAAASPAHRAAPPLLDEACALFLDVDGTLLDFAATPDGVELPPHLLDTLARLTERLDGALALVSGRPLAQLDHLFAPLALPAAGLHGQERRNARERFDGVADMAAIAHIKRDATRLERLHEGVIIEDKGANLALHWRGAPHAAPVLRSFAEKALTRLPGYRLQPGDHVLEFVPLGVDKGTAVSAFLLECPFRDRTPVFVGDDHTDEHGFAIANDHGGWSVLVGAREHSAAGYHLADPTAVHAWLQASLRALSSSIRPRSSDA